MGEMLPEEHLFNFLYLDPWDMPTSLPHSSVTFCLILTALVTLSLNEASSNISSNSVNFKDPNKNFNLKQVNSSHKERTKRQMKFAEM